MIIEINNFGPISNVKIDLSNKMTAIYGSNNIGKSYALQIIYLIMKYLREINYRHIRIFYDDEFNIDESNLFGKINKIINVEEEKNITDLIKSEVISVIKSRFVRSLLNAFDNTFKSYKQGLQDDSFIKLSTSNITMIISLKNQSLSIDYISKEIIIKRTDSNITKRSTSSKETIYYSENKKEYIYSTIREIISDSLSQIILSYTKDYNSVYFLPASRSGIYTGMSAFSGIVAELSRNKYMLSRKIELPGLSEAISDYFITLTEIVSKGSYYSPISDTRIHRLDKEIEKNILLGDVKFDKKTNSLLYTPKGKSINLSMDEVSSMVSEISPIVAFLRMITYENSKLLKRSNQFGKTYIFIEEPEAHLHPENQVKLIELFSELDKLGIVLFMTSHSNYVFNKFNNLVISGKLNENNYCPIHFVGSDKGSVSQNIDMDEFGAIDVNFLDTTRELFEERESLLLNKMNNSDIKE